MVFLILIVVILFCEIRYQEIIALSPSFVIEQYKDKENELCNISNENCERAERDLIDIKGISYFSNGRTLNATLWFENSLNNFDFNQRIRYGMYIDVDNNNNTGWEPYGFEYGLEIYWNNTLQTWVKRFSEYPFQPVIVRNENNYSSNFFGNSYTPPKAGFVKLSINLKDINYPSHYKV